LAAAACRDVKDVPRKVSRGTMPFPVDMSRVSGAIWHA
jgi:hypothetical protein